MKNLFTIAIVGRPNVGKSALFNRICRKRIAIVDQAEGVTRDRIYAKTEVFGTQFQIIDTGGIDPHSTALFNQEVKCQAEIAIEEADALIMVVDAYAPTVNLDHEVATILLRSSKPVILAVNKIDTIVQKHLIHQFHSLGIEQVIGVSALHGNNIAELCEYALQHRPKNSDISACDDGRTKLAIVGRPNVGKSTFINALLQKQRCVVSPIPGTTRDSIDTVFTYDGNEFTLIDTAGIRKKNSEHEIVDKFASMRTLSAIRRSDICLLMMDAQDGMTFQEKKILQTIEQEGKGCILLFNKWDLVKGIRMEHCLQGLRKDNPFLSHCPMLCMSALSKRNIHTVFSAIDTLSKEMEKLISTHELNTCIERALQLNPPPMMRGRRLRIYYATQINKTPPTFLFFTNSPSLMQESYKRYLLNQLRKQYSFAGLPLVCIYKGKKREKIRQ